MPSMKDSKVPAPKKMNNPMLKMHNPIHNGDSDSSEEDAGVAVKLTSVKIARPAGDSAGSDKDVPSGKQTLVIGKSARLGGKVVTKTVDMAKLTDGEKLEMAQQRKMARYEEIFNRFDSDGSGSIDTPELAHVLNALGHEVPQPRAVKSFSRPPVYFNIDSRHKTNMGGGGWPVWSHRPWRRC
jgi:hypothetical protein